jgi:hypothetical protein
MNTALKVLVVAPLILGFVGFFGDAVQTISWWTLAVLMLVAIVEGGPR